MNETFNIQGIILKREDYREVDCRILVYSLEKGLLDLVVRGAKKMTSKLAAHIEPISLVEIMVIKGKGKDYAGSVASQNCFRNIKEEYEKIAISGAVLRLVSEVIKVHEIDEDIFYLLLDFLNSLNSLDLKLENSEIVVSFFTLKLMASLGYQPVLESCLACGENVFFEKIFFDNKKGGLVCEKCFNNYLEDKSDCIVVPVSVVTCLKNVLENDFKTIFELKLDKNDVNRIIDLVDNFAEYHLV